MFKGSFFIKTALLLMIPVVSSPQTLTQRIQSAWQKFESDTQVRYATSSLTVINTQTGETVFTKKGNTGLAPASTLKTLTSATAFYVLEPAFRYSTRLVYIGNLAPDGTLTGNVLIKGSGDPTLGSERYAGSKEPEVISEWVSAVQKAGIKKISGQIIGDDRLFDSQTLPGGWTWADIGNYYGTGAPALTWRENQFDLLFEPGKRTGDPVKLRTEPVIPFLDIRNEVRTGTAGSGDNVYAYSAPYSNLVYLRGTYGIGLEKRIGASVTDPALDAATRLREALVKAGISSASAGTLRRAAQEELTITDEVLLDDHLSSSLKEIVYWLNQKSINLYAEQLLKAIGQKLSRETGTPESANAVRQFWAAKAGIDKNALVILDGSGLSPETRVTTAVLAQVLGTVKKEYWFPGYYESFPLINGMKMKSGSIKNVQAYAGYQTANGQSLAFSFIVNGYNGGTAEMKQKMFSVLDVLK